MKIAVAKNGPYLVSGNVPLSMAAIATDALGESVGWTYGRGLEGKDVYALCRCGASASKPFCDGTHAKNGFDGSETASPAPYQELAEEIGGPTLVLDDAESLCAFARFCDVGGSVWNLIGRSDDPAARSLAIHEAERCPSGRLVARDQLKTYEPSFDPSIVVVEDPAKECSGPLWVRGGVEVLSADGQAYPVRNRQTLCRCGASQNKPFCDGTHAEIAFNDGLSVEG